MVRGQGEKYFENNVEVQLINYWPYNHQSDILMTPDDLYYKGGNNALFFLKRGVPRKVKSAYLLLACAPTGCFPPVYPLVPPSYEVNVSDA